MRRLITFFVVLLLSSPASAETNNEAAIKLGISYLKPCSEVTSKSKIECTKDQIWFMDDFVKALSGDASSIHGVAMQLLPGSTSPPAVKSNKIEGCAWYIVFNKYTYYATDRINIQHPCLDGREIDFDDAMKRANFIIDMIHIHPTSEPFPNFRPPAARLEPRCDRTNGKLYIGPGPYFVPPAGCLTPAERDQNLVPLL
jgi:hypothetical protein